jgi:uroporphyrin-III C-methyltransferase
MPLNRTSPPDTLFKGSSGHVCFVGAGPGDPDLLTIKALRAFEAADVVIHDRLISPEILTLAGQSAVLVDAGKKGFGPSMPQTTINDLITQYATTGARVVRLKSGDPTVFGRLDEEIDACDAARISWDIVPGLTAASAAVAAIGQSLTKRGRNSSVRYLTGHDVAGFADHDWAALARPGEVAAIYMGKKSARFLQGRLLMHGASSETPLTIVENASRADQRILSTTLGHLPTDLAAAQMSGPALTFFGLAPRAAAQALPDLQNVLQKELA